jgi:hypothetical protein
MIKFNQFFCLSPCKETFSKIIKNSKVPKKPVENLKINTQDDLD